MTPGVRKVAALVVSALVTIVVVVAFWVLRAGGGADVGLPVPRAEAEDGEAGPVIGAFMRTVSGRLSSSPPPVRPLSGPVRFRALRVRLPAPGRDFLNADVVTGALDPLALRSGDVVITGVEVTRPRVEMVRSVDGTWNYETPLARLLEDDDDDDNDVDRRITITRLRARDGSANIVMPERTVTAHALNADLTSMLLSGPGLTEPRLHVEEGSARLTGLGAAAADSTLPVRIAAADLRFPDATVVFDAELVVLGDNALTQVAGVWEPGGPGFGLHATGHAADLRLADIRFLAPERIPEAGEASFRWSIEPLPTGDTRVTLTELTAATTGSTVTGSLTLVVGPGGASLPAADLDLSPVSIALLERLTGRELPFSGGVAGRLTGEGGDIRFDLAADLVADTGGVPFRTDVTGRLAFGDGGMQLRALTADLEQVPLSALGPWLPLPLMGSATGVIEVAGEPGTTPLRVDVGLEVAGGRALVMGTVDLSGEVPSYDLAGTLDGIALDALRAGAPPVSLVARFTARGSGTDPALMRSAFTVSGGFRGWESEPGDTIAVSVTVADGSAEVSEMVVRLAGLEGTASGDWRFEEPRTGRVTYVAGFTTLSAWGPYLPVVGDTAAVGSVVASGTISGAQDALRLEGDLAIEEAASGGWAVDELTATYTAGTGDAFEIVAEGTARGITTPTEGEFEAGDFSFSLQRPLLAVSVRAEASDGRVVQLVADGRVPEEGPSEAFVRELRLDLGGGQWVMAAPATVLWGEGSPIEVMGLVLEDVSATGRLAVDGVVWPLEDAAARVDVVDLPVADVQRLVGIDPVVTGLLSVAGEVRGPEDAPVVDLTFGLVDGSVEGVALSTVTGELGFAGESLTLTAAASFAGADTAGVVELRARLPVALTLSTSPDFRLLDAGPVEGELIARAVALAPLAPLFPSVREFQGTVDGRVTLGGSSEAPELGGGLALSGGSVRVPALNQRFTEIAGSFEFAERRLIVRELRARSGGTAVLTGNVTFERLTEPSFDLIAYLEGFRPLGVSDRTDASTSGRLVLSGTLDVPVLGGQVAVSDGYVTIPQFGSDAAFEDLGVAAPVLGQDLGGARGEGLMARLRIEDLEVRVGEGVWFVAQEARAQLAGDLTVTKSGEDMRIQGTLQGERGTYTLRAGPVIRRFEVLDAQVRFLGSPEVNPALAITARRVVFDESGRQLDVQVTIGGNLRNPTLGLASADAGNIPESELLSFLLFGRPTLELAAGGLAGETLLEATFLELATLELEQAIVGDLGLALDIFQVRFPGGVRGAAAPTVVLGSEVAPDVFLTVESGLSALFEADAAPSDTWGIRLEWAFDRNSSARVGWEPVTRGRFLRALGSALPVQGPAQQLFLELRRRWVY